MSAFPHLPLFTDAFIADTGHLSAQETGAYLMLMMVAWRSPSCQLPDNDDKLGRWARVDRRTWQRIKPTVMEFWQLEDGAWTQKRLSKERDYVSKRADVSRRNGEQGGRPKSLENHDTANPTGSSQDSKKKPPIPTPTPSKIDNPQDPKGSLPPEGAKRHRSCVCPNDFEPTEKHFDKAAARSFDRQFVLMVRDRMRDWSHANAGRPVARKADWGLTFHNFLDRAMDEACQRSPPGAKPTGGGKSNPYHDVTRQALEQAHGTGSDAFRSQLRLVG